MSDEKPPIAENEAPKEVEIEPAQDASLTKEQFEAQIQQLAERARVAGLNPIRAMAQTYIRQGMAMVEGLLASLESNDSSKEKKA